MVAIVVLAEDIPDQAFWARRRPVLPMVAGKLRK
jgi:hypothetical protein